jgi:hypothetical protein
MGKRWSLRVNQFRRVNGHLHLPKLRAALEEHFSASVSDAAEPDRMAS